MKCSSEGKMGNLCVPLSNEVNSFCYQGLEIESDGSQGREVDHRVGGGASESVGCCKECVKKETGVLGIKTMNV